ncbi:MAG: hypothetical protein EOP33_04960 [Rickettsiaceae bacterium]|nr:MAG: hypothetical protein EOP33_04960 [Rickettsiaceae bacterium]
MRIGQDGKVQINKENFQYDSGNQNGNGNFIRLTEDPNNQALLHKFISKSVNQDETFRFNISSEHHALHGITFHVGTIIKATAVEYR